MKSGITPSSAFAENSGISTETLSRMQSSHRWVYGSIEIHGRHISSRGFRLAILERMGQTIPIRGGSKLFSKEMGGGLTQRRCIVHEPRIRRADFIFAILNPRKWCFPMASKRHWWRLILCFHQAMSEPRSGDYDFFGIRIIEQPRQLRLKLIPGIYWTTWNHPVEFYITCSLWHFQGGGGGGVKPGLSEAEPWDRVLYGTYWCGSGHNDGVVSMHMKFLLGSPRGGGV